MRFSRMTIIKIAERLVGRTHAGLDKLLVEFGLEEVCPKSLGGLEKREAALIKYLVKNQGMKGPNGAELIFELAERVVQYINISIERSYTIRTVEEADPEFINIIRQDGYDIKDGKLITSLPEELDMASSNDEVRTRLKDYGFETTLGHLEQAIAAHSRSDWAAANAQLRTCAESLFDELARFLYPEKVKACKTAHARQELLASGKRPLLKLDLNEWVIGDKGGFIQGFIKRLHPKGSHPGLSDEEDSTFRLHLVLLVARHLLRRLEKR